MVVLRKEVFGLAVLAGLALWQLGLRSRHAPRRGRSMSIDLRSGRALYGGVHLGHADADF